MSKCLLVIFPMIMCELMLSIEPRQNTRPHKIRITCRSGFSRDIAAKVAPIPLLIKKN